MSADPRRRPRPAQAPPVQAAADPSGPLPVAVGPAAEGEGVVYSFTYTPAQPGPDEYVDYTDYDAEGNVLRRGRLPAAEAYRYRPRPLPAEGLACSPQTRPDPGTGRRAATEEPGPDTEADPPAPAVIVPGDRPEP